MGDVFCILQHTFVFILAVWTSNSSKRQTNPWYTLWCNGTAGNTKMKLQKFANYCENWFLQFNFSNVGQLYGSHTLLNANYFKRYTSRIFITHSLAFRPQIFINYLSEIKFADPIFGKFSINLLLFMVKF